jgi:translation elongation factor EF-1alpha
LQTNIKKYIFILNKIDKVEKPNETIKKCKAFFTNEIDSSLFRIEDNFFQPLN